MCKKSESIKNIAIALAKFNGEVSKIEKDSANPHFKKKYASLDNIIDEIRPILQRNGLSVIQMPGGDGEKFTMTTMLIHESGEWIESDPIVMRPVKNDPQGIGSCATYARRYSLAAFLSLNTGEDDDGNDATQPQVQSQSRQQSRQPSNGEGFRQPSDADLATTGARQPSSGTAKVRVYKMREELGWEWKELTEFAADVLKRQIKYLNNDVKSNDDWAQIEQALLDSRIAS